MLNQPEIRLYILFSDWFGSKRTSVSMQINRKTVNLIWFWVDLTWFRKNCSVWTFHPLRASIMAPPLNPSVSRITVVLGGFQGTPIEPPWCRETPASQVVVNFILEKFQTGTKEVKLMRSYTQPNTFPNLVELDRISIVITIFQTFEQFSDCYYTLCSVWEQHISRKCVNTILILINLTVT